MQNWPRLQRAKRSKGITLEDHNRPEALGRLLWRLI
jgi:hypothetical protein